MLARAIWPRLRFSQPRWNASLSRDSIYPRSLAQDHRDCLRQRGAQIGEIFARTTEIALAAVGASSGQAAPSRPIRRPPFSWDCLWRSARHAPLCLAALVLCQDSGGPCVRAGSVYSVAGRRVMRWPVGRVAPRWAGLAASLELWIPSQRA